MKRILYLDLDDYIGYLKRKEDIFLKTIFFTVKREPYQYKEGENTLSGFMAFLTFTTIDSGSHVMYQGLIGSYKSNTKEEMETSEKELITAMDNIHKKFGYELPHLSRKPGAIE